jgi:hypothetical protein
MTSPNISLIIPSGRGSFTGSTLVLVGALHTITNIRPDENENPKAYPAFKYMGENPSIAEGLGFVVQF